MTLKLADEGEKANQKARDVPAVTNSQYEATLYHRETRSNDMAQTCSAGKCSFGTEEIARTSKLLHRYERQPRLLVFVLCANWPFDSPDGCCEE